MAEHTVASFANKTVVVTLVYDDATRMVTAVRCVNGSQQSVQVTLSDDAARTFTRLAPSGTTQVAVPGNRQFAIKSPRLSAERHAIQCVFPAS